MRASREGVCEPETRAKLIHVCVQKFADKTFTVGGNTTKFVKVFTRETMNRPTLSLLFLESGMWPRWFTSLQGRGGGEKWTEEGEKKWTDHVSTIMDSTNKYFSVDVYLYHSHLHISCAYYTVYTGVVHSFM